MQDYLIPFKVKYLVREYFNNVCLGEYEHEITLEAHNLDHIDNYFETRYKYLVDLAMNKNREDDAEDEENPPEGMHYSIVITEVTKNNTYIGLQKCEEFISFLVNCLPCFCKDEVDLNSLGKSFHNFILILQSTIISLLSCAIMGFTESTGRYVVFVIFLVFMKGSLVSSILNQYRLLAFLDVIYICLALISLGV